MKNFCEIILLLLLTTVCTIKSKTSENKYLINSSFKFSKPKLYFKTLTKQPINTSIGIIELYKGPANDVDFKLNFLYEIERNSSNGEHTSEESNDDLFQVGKLQANEVEILTKRVLIYPKKYYFNLLAVNKTSSFIIGSSRVTIKVFNEEYLIPKFLINPYNVQISANTPVNSFVVKVCAVYTDDIDDDDGISATNDNVNSVVYKIESGDITHFSLNANNGELRTKMTNLDLKTFKISIHAINYKLPQYIATTVVNVKFIENSNFLVLFNQTEYNITINENEDYTKKPVVFELIPLNASNGKLNYVLTGSKFDLSTFEIHPHKGLITLTNKLDYELKSVYLLTIIVSDLSLQPIGYTYINVNVRVIDINNNPPKFTEPVYYFNILNTSSMSPGFVIGYIDAYDRDSVIKNNSKIAYYIDNYKGYVNFPFIIDHLNGSICLNRHILSQNLFDFNVIAKDHYGLEPAFLSSSVNVNVKVINVNQNYLFRFENHNYFLNASEELIVGSQILTLNVVNLIDKNSTLHYLINTGNYDNCFSIVKISNTRAQISLGCTLDYRKRAQHSLIIKVIDNSGLYATANLEINVIPANSQQPRFTKDLYDFSVYENATIGTLIGSINAIDGDFGDNGRIRYTLDNSIDNEFFKLDENYGGLYVDSKLDRETHDFFTLYVTATDNGIPQRMDRALIKVKILDCNDNKPQFTRNNYSSTIYEDSKVGTYIMRVEALDKDIGENSIIRYSFSNPNVPFGIDQISGIIRVSAKLDREMQDFYNLTLIATDLGMPSLTSSAILQIQILDVNDNAPSFNANELNFYLLENQPIGTEIGNITASDPDLGINADIVYKMLDGFEYFEIKSSSFYNTIILTSKFIGDFESNKTQFTFNLRAYSVLLFTDVVVKIQIKDINDNAPILPNPFKIMFNNYKNNFLIDSFVRIPAYDLDASDNLTYSLLDPIGKQFVNLNPNSGEIMLKPILNSNNQINAVFAVSVTGMYLTQLFF